MAICVVKNSARFEVNALNALWSGWADDDLL